MTKLKYILIILSVLPGKLFSQKASVVVQTGHFQGITCGAFSKDKKFVVTGAGDKSIIIYDANTAMQLSSFQLFTNELRQVKFTSDSKKVMGLSGNGGGKEVYFAVIDITKNDTIYTIRKNSDINVDAREFRLSFDEKIVVMRDDEEFFFFDFTTGKYLYTITAEGYDPNQHWHFTHDNKKIIFEDEKKGNISIIDIATKSIVKSFSAEVTKIGTFYTETGSVTPDDKYYLRCRGPENWLKYDLTTGELVNKIGPDKQNYSSPTDFYMSADSKTLFVNDLGFLYFFNAQTGKEIKRIDNSHLSGSVSFISDDFKTIVLATSNHERKVFGHQTTSDLAFIDVASGKVTKRFSGSPMRPFRVIFSNNSKNLAISCNMPNKIWNFQTADGLKSMPDDTKFNEKNLNTMKFSPDDQVLFSPDESQPDLVNIPTLEMKSYKDHFYHNYNVSNSSSNGWICPDNSFDKIIIGNQLRKFQTGEFQCDFIEEDAPNGPEREFTPDGKYCLIFSENRAKKSGVRVYVYSTADCKKVADYEIPVVEANEYEDYSDRHHAFAHDSKRVAIINNDYTLFDILTGKILVYKKIDRKDPNSFWKQCSPEGIAFSADDSKIAIANNNNEIGIIETLTGKLIQTLKGHQHAVNCVNYSPDGNLLASSSLDGKVILWDAKKGNQIATFIGLDSTDFIVTTPDNYYMSTKKGLKGVGFRVGNKMFPVEQFDLRQNRPDTVLQRIGVASKFLMKMYRMAWIKRVKKAGFTPSMLSSDFHVPDLEIEDKNEIPLSVQSDRLKIKVRMKDSLYALEKYNVYINDIPVYGSKGFSLKGKNLNKHQAEIDLTLLNGKNRIIVSAFNSKGAESTRETFDIVCEKSASKPDLYVLTIGVSEYSEQGHNLKFAVKDGNDLVNTLKTGNNHFGNVKTKTVFNKDATLLTIASLKSFFAEAKPEDQVILYFSGHGLLDEKLDYYLALHDVSFENPSKGGLPYDVLESLIDSIPARNRLVFIDACHSGEVDKDDLVADIKPSTQVVANARSGSIGVKPKAGLKNSFDYMNMLFSDVQRGTGASVISAAGGMEFALESQDWNNGVFTYSIINGLKNNKADFNKDGQVNLSELKQYIGKTVFELTNGKQNPTMRKENPGTDFIIFGK